MGQGQREVPNVTRFTSLDVVAPFTGAKLRPDFCLSLGKPPDWKDGIVTGPLRDPRIIESRS
ncbi:hypothetical protein NicSoilC12_36520 [Arthrobacter sp. NicSoilC12]|nr:hypothetical protein NicSoilC12_36520 [Arthrobacter sp. NicSoilC12]